MKRFLALALAFGLVAPIGLVGCNTEESGVKEETTVSTPSGETTKTSETKVETSGNNPPSATAPGDSSTTKTTP